MGFILTVEVSTVFAVSLFGLLFDPENRGDMFELHITSRKTVLFIVMAVRTSNPV
jgi:hypothetical protein